MVLFVDTGLDPDDVRRRKRLHIKVNELRTRLDNGEEISSERVRFTRNRAVHWAAWCRKAFLQMPGYEGTVDDVCAALLADPRIAPLLDHRVYASRRRTPCWVKRVLSTLTQIPGLVKTGEKQGKLIVYRYDSEAAELLAAAAKARRRQRAASMPHLGLQQ
ncbi:hypothetical protein CHLRE_08g383350v5 [Chlamydomonas reinhardtii]|uniref:Uncharacterized protein n=1 Tax=Chlamydomonas reinhardtii TaxID=3055 RepID=A0A2K3DI84_CHLRE|nr:uncharacterized protein CHLRE_08g383350v5 [Chlamydomonas reinhardtii]PNW80236.1 hypothetical protein CHLRE_08g383350v5 [Chlamydomonas reinhardtii]